MIDGVELQQLRYVVAVAREKNFTRAAQSCFVVQSALSQQIKALETELGVALFSRTSRRVELTTAGEAFLPAAQDCLDAAERAAAQAAAAVGIVRGPLRVGMIPTVTALDVGALLSRFRAAYPEVAISARVEGSDTLQADLTEGRLDVGFLGLPAGVEPSVGHRLLDRHRLVAVLPVGHRLAQSTGADQTLRLADLAGEAFADFPAGTTGRAQSDLAFHHARLTRTVSIEAQAVTIMLDLVGAGLAIALLPPASIPTHTQVTTRALTDGPERAEYIAWSRFNPTPAAAAFLNLLPDSLRRGRMRTAKKAVSVDAGNGATAFDEHDVPPLPGERAARHLPDPTSDADRVKTRRLM